MPDNCSLIMASLISNQQDHAESSFDDNMSTGIMIITKKGSEIIWAREIKSAPLDGSLNELVQARKAIDINMLAIYEWS